jgi:hypothetical protein
MNNKLNVKNLLLSLSLLILSLDISAAGTRQDIDHICSVGFPGSPQVIQMKGIHNYQYFTDTSAYLVQVEPITKKGVLKDSATLSAFYGGAIRGILRGFKASELGHKPILINGLEGMELEYVRPGRDHKPESVDSRMLMIRGRLVVYSFSAPYELYAPQRYLRDSFFSSIRIGTGIGDSAATSRGLAATDTTSIPTPRYDSVMAAAHQSAEHTDLLRPNTFHFVISFAISILLLLAVVYLVVRWRKLRERKK